jgi:hypothetical protein
VFPEQPSPAFLWLQSRLEEIALDLDAEMERVRQENRYSTVTLELPYAIYEKVWKRMVDVGRTYVQLRQNEVCPPKGTVTLDEAWPRVLLGQARNCWSQALGKDERIQAAAERSSRRRRIAWNQGLGDLVRAAPERLRDLYVVCPTEGGDGLDVSNRRLKAALFRGAVDHAKALRDRCDGGEFWFPSQTHTVHIASPGDAQTQAVLEIEPSGSSLKLLRRPGRKPQRVTESYRLVDSYLTTLASVLRSRNVAIAVTKTKLARALSCSKDTLNLFERESKELKASTREKLQTELTTGPSETIVAFFIRRQPEDE